MNITWGLLTNWMTGPWHLPAGWKLEYEFRPSLRWYPDIHQVHGYWIQKNPDKQHGEFWHLEKEEQKNWEDQYLQGRYRQYRGRKHWECSWQRFTLTDINGKQIILQMDNQGHVDEVKYVEQTVRVLVKV
jgi:hypothetical protein